MYPNPTQKKMKNLLSLKPMLFACAFFVFISQATYAQKTWDGGGDGTNWNSANNWNPNGVPSSSDAVTITQGQSVVVNVNNAVCAALNLSPTGNGIATLTFNANSKLVASGTVTLGQSSNTNRRGSLVMTNGGTLECDGFALANSGSNTFTSGTGTVIFTATNTLPSTIFTTFNNLKDSIGTTTLSANITVSGSLSVSNGATLALSTFTIGSPTSLNLECGAVTGSSITGSGTLTLGGNINVVDANTGTDGADIACPVALGATRTMTVADDGTSATDLIMSGVISGSTFGITKAGAGELHLSGTNTYTGSNSINAGILKTGNTAALGTAAAGTTVSSGAVLDLNGVTPGAAEALTLNGTGISTGGALINSSGTAASYSGTVTMASASGIGTTGNITISGVVSGAFALTKYGAGELILSGTNTYTGLTTITAGTLKTGNTAALGTAAAGTTVSSGAALDLNGVTPGAAEALTLNGTGVSNGGALTNTGGNASYSGNITLGSASTIRATSSGTLTCSGTVGTGAFGLTLDGSAGTGTMSGVISTPTSLTKNGAGTWRLSGTNTYTGTTTVSAGTLVLNNTSALGANTNSFVISTGANADLISNETVGSMTLGGMGTANGTWGFTSSGATYIDATFFTNSTTGRITVSNDSRTTPTVTPTVGTYTYNGSAQGPNAATNTGTGTSYTFSYAGTGGTTYGPSSTQPTNAGTYTVTVTVAANANFNAASSSATAFTIAQANLTITANNQNKCSGTTFTFAGTEFTTSGLVGGNTVTSATLTSTGSASTATAGTYSIVPTNATGTGLANYTISYVNGTLTVNALPNISNFSIGSVTNPAPGGTSTVTINSTSLANGTYTVTYNLSGDNTATGSTASVTIASGTGTFATSALATAGYTTIAITNINTAANCNSTISSGNTATILILTEESTTITNTATTTWTAPLGVTSVNVEVWGGGGRGGSTSNNGTETGGGGGGAYARDSIIAVTAGTTYNLKVGAGSTSTLAGEDSWFNTSGTVLAKGGNSVANNSATGATGGSSTNSIGDVKWAGGNGANGSDGNNGGGGGSSAGTSTFGANGSGSNGGTAPSGGGNGGGGRTGSNGDGTAGSAPGGGGGGVRSGSSDSRTGGAGARGQVKISYKTLTYKSQFISANLGSNNWCAGETRNVTVTIKNIGTATWTDGTSGTPDINIGVKWNTNSTSWSDYNLRANANNLAPGETGTYTFTIKASNNIGGTYGTDLAAGNNNLTFDVVYEGISWFGNNGGGVGPGNTVFTSSVQTINAAPSAPTGTSAARCGTGTVDLSASGTGTIRWYNAITGGTLLTSGNSYTTPSISSTTIYYVLDSNVATGCTSTRTAVTATVNAVPSAPTGTDGVRCETGTVSLSASGTGTIKWYNASTGGTLLGSGNSFTTPSISTTTIFYAMDSISSTGCVSATRTAVTATVNAAPSAPTGTGAVRCGTGTVGLSATGTGTIKWYDASTGGTLLGSGNNFTTPSISTTTIYYALDSNNVPSCVSATRTAVTATVNAVPSAPTGTSAARCGTGTVGLSASGTGTIKWYNASTGGTLLSSGNSYTTPSISATTIYYALDSINATGCVSATRTAVTATVNAVPSAPTGTSAARCGTGTVGLSASGTGTIKWYDASTGGTLLNSGNSYTTPSISSTTIYYALDSIVATGCISATRTAVTATVNAVPSAPTGTSAARCGTGTVGLSASGTGTIRWYNALTGGTLLSSGNSYTTPSISATTIYYALDSINATGCVSASRTAVTATVNAVSSAPTGTSASRCGTGTVGLSASGTGTIKWYNASTGGTLLTSGNSYTTPSISSTTIYYVLDSNVATGCTSTRTAVTATINTVPSAPTGTSAARCGTGTVGLSATGTGTIKWYDALTGGTLLGSGNSFTTPSISSTTIYYALDSINASGCVSATRIAVTATVNAVPSAPTGTDGVRCGTGTVGLSASGTGTIRWYNALTGGTLLGSGSSFTTPSISSTTIYYALDSINATGCVSATRTAVTATVNAVPSAPTGTSAVRCGTGTVGLSASGTGTIKWYNASTGGTLLSSGNSYTTPSISSTTTYFALDSIVATGCVSATRTAVTATVNALPTAVIATASSNTLCGTGTVNLTGSASGAESDTIKLLNFEITGRTLNYVASNTSNAGTVTGNSASGDRPASSPFFTTSNTGYRVNDGTATLTTDNITGLSGYTAKKVSMRLAAFSVGQSDRGVDVEDSVSVSISLNGGSTYSNELTIDGNNNAYWAYSATGVASVTYDGNNSPTTFAPTGGGSRTSDGYSTLNINIPDTASQVRIRVRIENSSGSEAWVVDDIALTGIQMAYSWTSDPAGFTSNLKDPTNVSVTQTTTYTLTATNADGCSATDTAIVRVNTNVGITSATAASSSICSSATTTLTANGVVGTNAVVTWWTGTGGTGTNLGTGTTLTNRGPGTYFARVTGDCGTAAQASVTVSALANAGITSATAASTSVCSGSTTTLTANGVVGTNAVVTWWTGTGGTGTNLGTGTTLTNRGPGTYFARVTADCGTAVEASVTIGTKVNVGITSATAASSSICSSATTTLTANGVVGTNAVVTWWTATGGTGTNLGTGTTISRGPGTYFARVTGDCGTAVEASVTVSALVNVGITSATAATSSICSSATTTLTANGVVGTNAVVTWWSGTGGTGTNYGTGTTIDRGPGTYYARVTGDCGTAVQAIVTVSALTNAGITSATAASASICASATTTLTANGVTGLNPVVTWWTGTGGTGTNLGTGNTLTNRGPGTYYARVTADCGTAEASVTVATSATPSVVVGTPSSSDICDGASRILNASATISSTAIDTVDFNDFVTTSYTTAGSASNGGNKFAIQNSPYNPNSNTYIITNNVSGSSDGTSFMVTTAANLNGSTTTTSQLISTVYNTQGYTDLKLVFNHSYVRNNGSGTSTVEVSTDGGTNWTTVKSYSSNQGARDNFVKDSIVLNAYINQSNLRIRFNANISASFAVSWWAIDKVLLKGNFPMTPLFSWSANTASGVNGLSANAQTYLVANSTITVSPTDTTLYTLTAKDPLTGCTTSATPITVNVLSNPSAPIATGASRCSTGRVILTATVGVDETVDWYTVASGGTATATGTDVWQTPSLTATTTYYLATRNTTTGCVSVTRTPVVATINDVDTTYATVTNCVNYLWNGTTYTNSGTYTYNTTSSAGCDSTAILNLTITVPTESSVDITNCDSYIWNGTTYITSGTYTFTTTNSVGCDSIATLNLTINRSTTFTENITNCDTYTWNGTTYSNSGTYSFSTTNSVGCDSTAILNLTINRSSASPAVNITVCDAFTWNENTYTATGVYTYSTTNSAGCDSTATLNLTVKKSTTSTTVVEACDAYRWNNATYSASGIFTYTTTNSVGCDSVASLDLTIKYSTSFEFSASNCDNYLWNGVTYSASGTYSFTTTNAVGCDSVATLNLTILESSTSATTESACEQYSWNGVAYTNSGTYTYLSTNASGCTSTDTLHLTIKRATTSTTDEISCETFAWNGSVYSNTGTFTYNTTNSVGCDSVALLNLTILNGTNETIYAESCVNYFINDSLYTESGTYTQRLVNSVGCDSILTIILTINQGTFTSNTVTACDSYLWNNILYTQSGQFIVYYNNAQGCLSADTLYLTIKNSTTSSTTISACDSYSWNGEEYTASGVYTFVTTNAVNCDSTATLNLTIETAPNLDPISGLTEVCRYVNTTYTNSTANGRWSSDDTTVLQIDSITGIATAVSAGVANITYTIRTELGCTNSIALAVTVNASTLVSISGPDNVCVADSITLIGSEDGGAWSIDNASIASIESATGLLIGSVSGNVQITYTYTEPSSGCVSTGTYNVVVNALPSAPDTIFGLNELCQYVNTSDTIEYSVPLVSGISNYFWTLPVGATLVSGQNTSTIRVIFTDDLPRAGAKIYVNSVSDAGCYSGTTFLRIYKTIPYLFTLTGPNNACPLVGTETIVYYTTNISATANYYDWVVPSGATIVSGQGTYQIGVTYDTSFRSGYVRVRGLSNCGVFPGTGKYLAIVRNLPTVPGFVNGPTNVCEFYNNGTEVTYSVADVEFATGYLWTLPNNVTLVSGQGTNTIVVRFEAGFVNSSLKVRALSNCNSTLDRSFNITANPFAVPTYVSGPTNACMYINTGNMATYVCSKSTGAPAYIWTVPAGVTIIERPGDLPENDTIIRVLFDENFVSATSIQVQTTGCNTSLARTIAISKTSPTAPSSVTGFTNVCNYIGSNTPVRYSTRRVLNASQYLWTVPNDAQVQSYDGDTAVNVTFNSGYVTGMIEARTSNACAVSSARVLSVSRALPATPSDISGPTNSCAYYANGTTATYSISAVQGATGYAWTLPSNVTLVSGQNTTSITVRFDSGFATSSIKVKSLNTCAASLDKTLRVTATPFAAPGTITGPTNSCIYINDGIATYTIRKVANATGYLWTVPTGATIIDHPAGTGALDTIIKVTYTPDFLFGSSIRVQSMGCGLSNARTLAVTGSISTTPGSITGTSNVCEFMESSTNPNGIIATYRIRKVSTANAYAWSVPDEAEIVGHPGGLGVNDTAIMVKFEDEFIGGSIKVRSSNSCGSSAERSFTLTRTQPSTPGAISTTTLGSCPNRSYRYSIASMPTNATSVVWTVPASATIVSQTSLSITVSYPSGAITGSVKAQSFNNCSSSDFRTLSVRYTACPNSLVGTTPVATGRVEEAKVEVVKPLSLGVSVYPNPTTSSFRVKVKAVSTEKLHIKLMDMAGRILKIYQTMPGEDLNFGNELKAGVYMIEVTQGNLKSVERLMKF